MSVTVKETSQIEYVCEDGTSFHDKMFADYYEKNYQYYKNLLVANVSYELSFFQCKGFKEAVCLKVQTEEDKKAIRIRHEIPYKMHIPNGNVIFITFYDTRNQKAFKCITVDELTKQMKTILDKLKEKEEN